MSSLVNKVKEAVRGDKSRDTQPARSLDGTTTDNTAGYGGVYADPADTGPRPHNVANQLDSRADSDLDGSRTFGVTDGAQHDTHYGAQPNMTGNAGYGDTCGGFMSDETFGQHFSNLLFSPDSTTAGYGTHYSGTTDTTGGICRSTNAGPYDSNVADKPGPRLDSDLDGCGDYATHQRGTAGTHATPGSSSVPNTAGPYESGLDGSKSFTHKLHKGWVGSGDKTGSGRGLSKVDTHDAARVPPSVFAAHHGDPVIDHDDHQHNRAARHGSGPDDYGSGIV
ncbi:MAG: hypothetical protein M1840_004054 [Geoglossum simile]|nr:MAG: hypothetical protein M1840_004054 [Geoglossum simile]